MLLRASAWVGLLLSTVIAGTPHAQAQWLDRLMQDFAASDILFSRSDSNVPFIPAAFVDATAYRGIELEIDDVVVGSFDQSTVSQGAGLPILLGPRDALVIGEWLSWNRFETNSSAFPSFDVLSVGLPVGWLRQVDPTRQAAAFVMPLAHKASLPGADWRWEFMGGAFGRHVESDDFWWAYGFFADVGPGEDIFVPYLGATCELTEQWTISAVMPWPAVLYAPTRDTLLRLGASPSGASWSLAANREDAYFELGNWDLGLAAEHRVQGNVWLMIEAGIGGMRTLRVSGGDWQGPELEFGASPYLSIGLNFRPAMK